MDRNFSEQYFSNNNSAQSNPSKLQEARLRKAMQIRVQSNLQLTNVIGLTSFNKHSIQFHPITGECYYIAGSIIIVYSIDSNTQKRYIFSPNKRNLTTICFSSDGRYLAAGEGTCKNPEIIIWDLNASNEIEKPIKQLRGHKYGLRMMFFSPNHQYLISIGNENDKGLLVWDWQSESRLTQNKLSKVPTSACFSRDGSKFVTCGEKHIKFWQFSPSGEIIKTPVKEKEDAFILEGKSVSLGQKFQEKTFSDCCFDLDSKMLYAATSTGQLSIIDENRVLNKWMDLKVPRIFSICLAQDEIICACADSFIRVFKTISLDHIVTFPKIPALLQYNIEKGTTKAKASANKSEYADVVGIVYDDDRKRVGAIYSDRSLFIWDISQLDKVVMKRSFLSHSGRINDLQILNLPSSSEVTFFMTTSVDKTVRIWHEVCNDDTLKQESQLAPSVVGLRRNAYSKNLSRIIYMTNDVESFKFKEPITQDDDTYKIESVNENTEHPTCVRCTRDGQRMIIGSSYGRLSIIRTVNFEVEYEIQAHDQEISTMDVIETASQRWVATGSRDRTIKVFDLNSDSYKLISILDDHNSMVSSLRFASVYSDSESSIFLISASTDRQIIFREYKSSLEAFSVIHREVEKISKINSFDLSSDHTQLVVAFDKKISIFSAQTGRLIKTTETKDEETPTSGINNVSAAAKGYLDNLSVLVDESSSYIASYNSDKVIRIRDCSGMSVVSKASCGDSVSGMAFTLNNSHLVTSSIEGCIYIWKMSADLKKNIDKKRQQLGIIQRKLQDVFKQEDLNLGSFWIEDEMRMYLQKQQQLLVGAPGGQAVKPQQDFQIDQILGNLRPADLMKNTNLPNWAKSKPVNMNQMLAPSKNDNSSNALNNENDGYDFEQLNVAAEVSKVNKKFEEEKYNDLSSNQQQGHNSKAFGGIGGGTGGMSAIEDSLNMRVSSNASNNLNTYLHNNQYRQRQSSNNFGYDSINEREDDDGLFGSRNIQSQIGSVIPSNHFAHVPKPNSANNTKGYPPHHGGVEGQKGSVPGGVSEAFKNRINLADDDDEEEVDPMHDEVDFNQDQISAFLSREQFSAHAPKTTLGEYSLTNHFGNLVSSSHLQPSNQQYQSQQQSSKQPIQQGKQHQNTNLTETVVEDVVDFNSDKPRGGNPMHITYKKDNGLVSIFDPEQIKGQLNQVELNMKQLPATNFAMNIFESQKMSDFMGADAFHEASNSQSGRRQRERSGSAAEDDKGELGEVSDDLIILDEEIDDDVVKADTSAGFGVVNAAPVKQGKFDTFAKEDTGNVIKPNGLSQMQSKLNYLEEPTNPVNGGGQGTKLETGKFPALDVIQERKDQQQQQKNSAVKSGVSQATGGSVNQSGQKVKAQEQQLASLGEEIDDEIDESYMVVQKKEFQQYQQQIDGSFKIILEQLGLIEDLVENHLDSEALTLRKKVHEKIAFKSNKVKAILQNIAFKHAQIQPASANVSTLLENDMRKIIGDTLGRIHF